VQPYNVFIVKKVSNDGELTTRHGQNTADGYSFEDHDAAFNESVRPASECLPITKDEFNLIDE
jgi:hypothetical protein